MTCKHCGAQVPEGGVFCPACGKRADGKIHCPTCDNLIPEASIYCTYCGARVDGKKVCDKCGEVFDGVYCPKCGVKADQKEAAVPKTTKKKATKVKAVPRVRRSVSSYGYKNVARVLTPSLLLAALLATFICSFFIGIRIVVASSVSVENTTFYFFGKYYNELETMLGSYDDGNLAMMNVGYYLPAIVTTVVLAVNLLVSFTTLLAGAIKYCTGMYHGKEINLTKLACYTFGSFVVTSLVTLGLYYNRIDADSLSRVTSTQLSGGALAGIIVGGVLILAALILKKIAEGKASLSVRNIVNYVISLATVALLFAVGTLATTSFAAVQTSSVKTTTSPAFFMLFVYNIITGSTIEDLSALKTLPPISYALSVVTIILAGVMLAKLLSELFSSEPKGTLALSVLVTVFALSYAVLAIVTASETVMTHNFLEDNVSIGIDGTIAVIILTIVTLGCAIAQKVLNAKKDGDEETSD